MIAQSIPFTFIQRWINMAIYLLKASRPKQWIKGLFILFPIPFTLMNEFPINDIVRILILYVAFCPASSAVYLINDIGDRHEDRKHPKKSLRPIASGLIPIPIALTVAITMAIVSIGIGMWLGFQIALLIISYIVLNILYTSFIKHVLFLDVLLVGIMYGIRVFAAFIVANTYPPFWYGWAILAALVGCLVSIGKRNSEFKTLGPNSKTRKVLKHYSLKNINAFYWIMCLTTFVVYPFIAYAISPMFVGSVILVILGLKWYWEEMSKLDTDTHPQKVIFGSIRLRGVLGLFMVYSFVVVGISFRF